MKTLLISVLVFISPLVFSAETLPPLSIKYSGALIAALKSGWSENPYPYFLAGQIEQETCTSVTSKKCWNPTTELKTSREYGFGLGQITITEKFNNFDYVKSLSPELKSWKWENRYDPYYQILALVALDKLNYGKLKFKIDNEIDKQAFMFSAYNGGLGGVLQDRRLCATKLPSDCDPSKWFGNVEKYSFKSKTKVSGYGKSFFDVNREYVKNVIYIRSGKYKQLWH
jgi:hypothetical protein